MADEALKGISVLINKENVKPDLRSDVALATIEHRLLKEGKISAPTENTEEKFMKEIQSASKALGISLDSDDEDDDKETDSRKSGARDSRDTARDRDYARDYTRSTSKYSYDDYDTGSELGNKTMESRRREHIYNVLGESESTISFDRERKEDYKLEMLAEIDDLKQVLANTQADLSRIPEVGPDSEYEPVEQVLKILRHKNDMERGCTMMEELILLVTYAAEEVFDGENEFLGHKPNIRGYHNHVSAKFRRMRADTGQAMNTILQELNIPGPIKMLIELIPGAIMYSHTKSRQTTANHTERMNTGTRNIRSKT